MDKRSRRIAITVAVAVVALVGGALLFLGHPGPRKPVHHVLPVAAATPTPTPRVPPTLKAAVTTAPAGTPVAFTATGLIPGGLGVFSGIGELAGICRASAKGSCLFDWGSGSPGPRSLVVTDVASALESQPVTITYTGNYMGPGYLPQSGPGSSLWWDNMPSPTLTVARALATVGSKDAYTIRNVVPGITYAISWGKVVAGSQPMTFCSPTSGSHTCSGTLSSTSAGVQTYDVSEGFGASSSHLTAVVRWIISGASTP